MKATWRWLIGGMACLLCAWPSMALAAQQLVVLPKGTVVHKLSPGHFRFMLPDGRKVDAHNLNLRTGIIGDCGVFDISNRKLAGGLQCNFRAAPKPLIDPDPPYAPGASRPPSPNFVQIDDEVTWLPVTLIFNEAAIIDPQPPGAGKPGLVVPGQQRWINPQPEPPLPARK